jgi:hypothetical protein
LWADELVVYRDYSTREHKQCSQKECSGWNAAMGFFTRAAFLA